MKFLLILIFISNVFGIKNNSKICNSIKASSLNDLYNYRDCEVVLENVVLFNIKWNKSATLIQLLEIKGFVLIYDIKNINSIGDIFPNLALIRGRKLLQNYGLIIKETDAEDVGLVRLKEISNGGLLIDSNPSMCYTTSIKWKEILKHKKALIRIVNNRKYCFYQCPEQCQSSNNKVKYCWNAQNCQKFCDRKCHSKNLYCSNSNQSFCCHAECQAGCHGDTNQDCVACRHYIQNETCVSKCSDGYVLLDDRCIEAKDCVQLSDNRSNGVVHYSINERKCVGICPENYQRNEGGYCIKCLHNCTNKYCDEIIIKETEDLKFVRNCYYAKDVYISIQNTKENLDELLIDAFKNLKIVEKSIKIIQCTSLKTLNFLRGIEEIRGQNINPKSRTMIESILTVYENDNLLVLWTNQTQVNNKTKKSNIKINSLIKNPPIKFALNKKLCPYLIYQFIQSYLGDYELEKVDQELINISNGDSVICRQEERLQLSIIKVESRLIHINCSSNNDVYQINDNALPALFMIKPTNTNISQFEIYDSQGGDNSDWIVSEGYLDQIMIFSDLIPATRYAMYVESFQSRLVNWLQISDVEYFTTLPDAPSPPTSLEAEVLTHDAIKFNWGFPAFPNGVLTHYLISFVKLDLENPDFLLDRDFCEQTDHKLGQNSKWKGITSGGSKSGKEKSMKECNCADCFMNCDQSYLRLKKMKKYQFYIQFNNDAMAFLHSSNPESQVGEFSEDPNQQMGELDSLIPPEVMSNETLHPEMNYYNWTDQVIQVTTSPKVKMTIPTSSKSKNVLLMNVLSIQQSSFTYHNLKYYTEYKFSIAACQNLNGFIDSQNHSIATYNKQFCSKIHSITAYTHPKANMDNINDSSIQSSVIDNSICISWSAPINPNGVITHYRVRYRLISNNSNQNQWSMRCVRSNKESAASRSCVSKKVTRSVPIINTVQLASINITELHVGIYEFQVKAYSLESSGNWTPSMQFVVAKDKLLGTAHIYYLIIGLILLLLIVVMVILVVYYYKKKQKSKRGIVSSNPNYWLIYDIDEWEISRDKVDMLDWAHPLGRGSFGMVYKGAIDKINTPANQYLNQFDFDQSEQGKIFVAVKTLNSECSILERKEFINEACYMKQFQSYHLVKLIGVVTKVVNKNNEKSKPVGISFKFVRNTVNRISGYFHKYRTDKTEKNSKTSITVLKKTSLFMSEFFENMPLVLMELMVHGDLTRYLREKCEEGNISESQTHLWALQIADGMLYLSDNKFVHRDLAARNCLINEHLVVKIGDFGMARDVYYDCYYRKKGRARIPVRWTSPEALSSLRFTTESDVWSYGVVLWEIITMSSLPYKGMSHQEVIDFVSKGGNLILNDPSVKLPKIFRVIMRKCWLVQPSKRITFFDIINHLIEYADSNFRIHSYYTQDRSSSIDSS